MAYNEFAYFYDEFNGEADYDALYAHIHAKLKEHGIHDGILADLGCGTGELTLMLTQAGYDMIGIDYSEEMLELAAGKRAESGQDILYLCQDLREFELYGTVRAVVSICDCINYITDPADLAEVFSLVNNYLDPGGVFIFDLNTEYKYAQVMGDTTVAEDREESSFIWDNQYDPEERINIYDLAIFLREENGLYRKYQETHYQRAYSVEEIQEALALAGMEFVTAYDAFTKDAPRKESERIYVIAREHGKKQNN